MTFKKKSHGNTGISRSVSLPKEAKEYSVKIGLYNIKNGLKEK